MKLVSQRTIVETVTILEKLNLSKKTLYACNFRDWFISQAEEKYSWNWFSILVDLRNCRFFTFQYGFGLGFGNDNITGLHMTPEETVVLGERLIQALVSLACLHSDSGPLLRSLETDGLAPSKTSATLIPLEGPVNIVEQEDALKSLVKQSGLPNASVISKHMDDAHALFVNGQYGASLGQSRNIVQALFDSISEQTNKHGGHSTKLGSGTKHVLDYLRTVGFFTEDEKTAYGSAWGMLSAGSHPGIPEKQLARIGLVLALEFGQLLLLKYANWSKGGHKTF